MDGYSAWKLHRAIKFHLLTLRYDIFKHRTETKNSDIENFLKQSDRKIFEFIGKQFERPYDAVQFFVANIAYTGNDGIYESGLAWQNYLLWVKHKESLTKLISDDLEVIDLQKDILESNPPRLLSLILAGKVLPETAVAINRVKPFVDDWLKKDFFGVGNYPLIIKKLDKFVNYDTEKIEALICQN